MFRWLAVVSVLLLSGCVTTREIVYRDVYRDSYPADTRYSDGSYRSGGTYYSPSYDDRGDYYYREPSVSVSYGYGYHDSSWYLDYPYYYSVFWPMYRSWYDPYWYPGYYYGVTYFPRNYLSIGLSYRPWRSHYSYWYYSPYRYSSIDNYYDWSPWYYSHRHHRDRYSNLPRFGSARNEAERLSRVSDRARYRHDDRGYPAGGRSDAVRRTPYGTYGTTRSAARDADYGSRTAPRMDPGTRGFGVPVDGDVRRSAPGSTRALPAQRGFGVDSGDRRPAAAPGSRYERDGARGAQREVDRVGASREPGGSRREAVRGTYVPGRSSEQGGIALPRQGSGSMRPEVREASRYERSVTPPREPSPRAAPMTRSYDRETSSGDGYVAPVRREARGYAPRAETPRAREYSAPTRGYEAPARGYDAPARSYSAPAPAYSAPASPSYSAPARSEAAPRYSAPQAESSPRYESRSSERSDSGRSSGDGEVRRVGSRRDD